MLMINNQNELVEGKFIGKNIDKIIIGPNVTYIPENCFNSYRNLNEITFEGNINNIEAAAFMGCENLKTINANNINIIKDFAFYGCNNIVDFNVDENIANNIKFGSSIYINDNYLSFDKIEAQLRYIKSGNSGTLLIEDQDSKYKLENATSLHFRF